MWDPRLYYMRYCLTRAVASDLTWDHVCQKNNKKMVGRHGWTDQPACKTKRVRLLAGQRFPLFPPTCPPLFPFFGPRVGDPREGRGDVAIPRTHGPPRRQGLGSLGWRRE